MNTLQKNIKNKVKEYFKNYQLITINATNKFFSLYPEIAEEIKKVLLNNPNWESYSNILSAIKNDISLPICKTCGKELKYYHYLHKRFYCSRECAAKDTKEKRKQTCLLKYGVTNPANSKKAKETLKKKYNCENSSQIPGIDKKKKETSIQNYGVESYSLYKGYQKILSWNEYIEPLFPIEEYKGFRRSYKWKCKQCGREFKANIHPTAHINRGSYFDHVPRCPYCYPIKSYYIDTILTWSKYIIPLFTKEEYEPVNKKKTYKWKCTLCGNEFQSHIHATKHIKEFPYLPRCLKCFPILKGYSKEEKELVTFCRQYFPNLKHNNKTLIPPLELDIVIPEKKLAIEFNGIYWHSTKEKELGYHLKKTELVEAKGYQLIHIWESDWQENKTKIQQKLVYLFQNPVIIQYNKKLDRCWAPKLDIPNTTLIEYPPELFKVGRFEIENCGYLEYIPLQPGGPTNEKC